MFPTIHGVVSQVLAASGGGGGGTSYLIEAMPSLSGFTNANQLGWEFTANESFNLAGLRVYSAQGGADTLRLWAVTGTTLLDSVAVTSVTDTWVEGLFSSPVALTNGQNYIITHHRTDGSSRGFYVAAAAGFTIASKVTHVQARFRTNALYPTSTNATNLYTVDGVVAE